MRQLLTFALILVFAGTAFATDLGSNGGIATIKDDSHVLQNPTMGRDGGDDASTAVAIAGLPFNDTGSTGGSSNAWDEVCPYSGSLSPDKWYSFAPTADMEVFVDLLGSTYDTKTYILDADMNVVACNDDFYSDYVSKIESAMLYGGMTYYIVVDGYGSDFGDFVIAVGEVVPCLLPCDGVAEGEPDPFDGYDDNYNGGCNATSGTPFQELVADEYGNLTFCGVGGWHLGPDFASQYRDTDWFLATIGASGTVTWTLEAEESVYGFLLAPQDCPTVGVAEQILADCGSPQVMVISGTPGSTVWLWVGSSVFAPPSGGTVGSFGYRCDFTGLEGGPIATEPSSWDNIKSMYR